ncbi:MAG: TonB family protein [Thermoanaerobaculum sp.]|nr:TonB family protein [Thermoanaerobaculum sp.]
MPITGSSRDLPLLDLVQANVLARNTCRITLVGRDEMGFLYLEKGKVVHASFASLEGREAFFALMGTASDLFYHLEPGISAPKHTIHEGWEPLVLEAMQRQDEGRLPQAAGNRGEEIGSAGKTPVESSAQRSGQVSRGQAKAAGPGTPKPSQARRRPRLAVALGALMAIGAAARLFLLSQRPTANEKTMAAVQAAEPTPIAWDAAELTAPGDQLPTLVSGEPPISPLPDLSLKPTIICRLLIDQNGHVQEAKIFQSRLDLAAFEKAALQAVERYRFRPALRQGKPVPVWINWPVTFK